MPASRLSVGGGRGGSSAPNGRRTEERVLDEERPEERHETPGGAEGGRFRLGRLQRLILVTVAEADRNGTPPSLADLSRAVAEIRGHSDRADRKKVHKNTFYRAVQSLCDKGYLRRLGANRGLRLLKKGRQLIEHRALSLEEEQALAREKEARLLVRQAAWRREGRSVGGRH